MISRLLDDHQKLRAAGMKMDLLLSSETCCDLNQLAALRWEVASLILRHLPIEDRVLFHRLEGHPSTSVVSRAAAYRSELDALYGRFRSHTEAWTREAIALDWDTYRRASATLISDLLDRMEREETELYPRLADVRETEQQRRPTDRNWAADAPQIRSRVS